MPVKVVTSPVGVRKTDFYLPNLPGKPVENAFGSKFFPRNFNLSMG